MRMINKEGMDLIRSFEGKKLSAYTCPAGVLTIGYGHTGKVNGKQIYYGQVIDDDLVEELFHDDMKSCSAELDEYISGKTPHDLNDNQFSALVSFVFNCGLGAFKSSTAWKRIRGGDYAGGANALLWWNKFTDPKTGEKEVLKGLVRRRQAERELFLSKPAISIKKEIDLDKEKIRDAREKLYALSKFARQIAQQLED